MAFLPHRILLTTVGLLLMTVTGCSSTREIEASPPRPRQPADAADPAAARQARLTIFLETGETELPEDVAFLRFRIAELHLRQEDGEWIRLPADLGLIELERDGRVPRKTILDTRIPPADYDSLAIFIDRVFVNFDANSGGPLTLGREEPLKMAVGMAARLDVPTRMHLAFEPGPSLTRNAECRWYFLPFIRTELGPEG